MNILNFYQFTFVSKSFVRTSLSSRHKAISRWRGPGLIITCLHAHNDRDSSRLLVAGMKE